MMIGPWVMGLALLIIAISPGAEILHDCFPSFAALPGRQTVCKRSDIPFLFCPKGPDPTAGSGRENKANRFYNLVSPCISFGSCGLVNCFLKPRTVPPGGLSLPKLVYA